METFIEKQSVSFLWISKQTNPLIRISLRGFAPVLEKTARTKFNFFRLAKEALFTELVKHAGIEFSESVKHRSSCPTCAFHKLSLR